MGIRKQLGRPRRVADDEVLAAALRVIDRVGPAGLTLAAAGAEAGLGASTVAERFGSKRALLLAVSRSGLAHVDAAFAAAARRRGSRLAALHAALGELVGGIDTPATLAHHLAFLQLDLVDPELHAVATEHSRLVRRHVSQLLQAAQATGELGAVDHRRLAMTVLTTYSGAMVTWAVDGRGSLAAWLRREVEAVLAPHRRPAARRVPSSA